MLKLQESGMNDLGGWKTSLRKFILVATTSVFLGLGFIVFLWSMPRALSGEPIVLNGPFELNRTVEVKDSHDLVNGVRVSLRKYGRYRANIAVSFRFGGNPGEFDPIQYRVVGLDEYGEELFADDQVCNDGRTIPPELAVVGNYRRVVGRCQPETKIPLESFDNLTQIRIEFSKH